MNKNNIVLATDSYKLNHWNQYPKDTEGVYSYFEARVGAKFPYTVFVGLQAIMQEFLEGTVVTQEMIDDAEKLATAHFGNEKLFNKKGWQHILDEHGGKLPLRIKAVPEGSVIPINNVMMTVENTDPECFWLTNAVESLLTHVWYPSTVATLSRTTKEILKEFLNETGDDAGIGFMLHDFGYRGAATHDAAALGGMGHLVNFVGTDTLPAMLMAQEHYDAELDTLAFSVPATEHSVMTSMGKDGEQRIVDQLLTEYPEGILSCVADSFDIYDFVKRLGRDHKKQILARDGVFVVRPDSVTTTHNTPPLQVVWILNQLAEDFGAEKNAKGYLVLNPKVRVLWGDGIDQDGIRGILTAMKREGFAAENIVFGMGGGLLQKINRDTQRFAFKASAIKRDGGWVPVRKTPLDASKASKAGRMALVKDSGGYRTVGHPLGLPDELVTVFENGEVTKRYTFDEVRERAAL